MVCQGVESHMIEMFYREPCLFETIPDSVFPTPKLHGGGNTLCGAIGPSGGGGAIRHRAAIS